MPPYKKNDYSISNALENIGEYFWKLYREDLKEYAQDRTRTDIVKRIHNEWNNPPHLTARGTDIRIDWALAIYDHGDWEKSLSCPVPPYKEKKNVTNLIDPRRKYTADYRCDNGIYVRSISELCIANWLYVNKFSFEYERQVIFNKSNESAHCDFYLPDYDVYIEYWGMTNDSAYMDYKQWKEPLYAENGLKLISLTPSDLKNFRDRFTLALRKYK